MADSDPAVTYPCYFLYCVDDGLACISTSTHEHVCLCLFTDAEVLRNFARGKQLEDHGENPATRELEVVECLSRSELVETLKADETDLAEKGIHYIAVDPVSTEEVGHILIREFIELLSRK